MSKENAPDFVDMGKKKKCFLIPTAGRLIIKEDEFEYHGVIAIPETAKQRPTTGDIVAVATDGLIQPNWTIGTRVVFANFSGTLIKFRNQPAYRILSEDEILAIVTKSNKELIMEDEAHV
ncbi:hypothetical protein LCGC14_1687760 [marine sediment metagenome]|uniref:10 kDa chaperonin n=1 Tax=marine sediment metagenome TaxID=412755 RepID=A0A0F9K2A8_9ZZZZ